MTSVMGFQESYRNVVTLFNDLIEQRLAHSDPSEEQMKAILTDQQGLFRVWAENVGAHREGKVSLDHRLREASHVRESVHELLSNLQTFLREAIGLLDPSQNEELDEFSDSEFEETVSGKSEEPSQKIGGNHENNDLHHVCSDISHVISSLFRISMLIQNPATQDKGHKLGKIDVSHFNHYEMQRLKDRFSIPEFLIDRLVRANLKRRQQFVYWKTHHEKIVGFDTKSALQQPVFAQEGLREAEGDTSKTRGSASEAGTRQLSQTTATVFNDPRKTQDALALGKPERPRFLDPIAEYDRQSESGETHASSVASSSGTSAEGRSYVIPNPPKPFNNFTGTRQHFECPYCHRIIQIARRKNWKNHVLKDLQPYVCTFQACSEQDRMFTTTREWYMHELQYHRREWVCDVDPCEMVFTSAASFHTHLKDMHNAVTNSASSRASLAL
ncbi:hypothetical protein BDZ91DRAFT_507809 [Kalaharituber pfeilii]|nr:hypothetical protein BDZ91DRAFT_507809 [Kalaharituber pfeilii]